MIAVVPSEKLPIAQARVLDPGAWDQLFRRYQLPLYSFLFELVRQEQTALDLVQETFISAAKHIQTLSDDSKFGSWLFSIAHQKCAKLWRKPNREEPMDSETIEEWIDDIPSPDAWLVHQESTEALYAALETLPASHRSVIMLHFLEDFSLQDIASITQTPVGTVKSRLHYAKRSLRHRLEGKNDL